MGSSVYGIGHFHGYASGFIEGAAHAAHQSRIARQQAAQFLVPAALKTATLISSQFIALHRELESYRAKDAQYKRHSC